jgi:hypothetical protein
VSYDERRLNVVEVWDDVELGGGTRIGFISPDDILSAVEFRELNGADWVRLDIYHSEPDHLPLQYETVLQPDTVIRVIEGSGVWREYRIREMRTRRDPDGALRIEIEAWHIVFDLQVVSPLLEFRQANSDIWLHNEWVDLPSTGLWDELWWHVGETPQTPSYINKGTVPSDPTLYDFTLDWETPGSGVIELAKVLNLEVSHSYTSTGYTVSLSTGWNSTLDPVLIAYHRNQVDVRRTRSVEGTGTRIYPKGLGDDAYTPAIGQEPYELRYTSSSTQARWHVRVPTFETNQLAGLYLEPVRQPDTIIGPLVESYATSTVGTGWTVFQLSTNPLSTAGPSNEDWAFLRVSTDGHSLNYVPRAATAEASTKIRPLVLDRQDIPVVTNLFRHGTDPASSEIGEFGLATSVARSGSSSPYVQYGARSLRISLSTGAGRSLLLYDVYPNNLPLSEQRPHLSWQTWFYLESGQVGVSVGVGSSQPFAEQVNFPSSTSGAVARASAIEQWHHIAIAPGTYDFVADYPSTLSTPRALFFTFYSLTTTGPTIVYVDALQVVNSPVPSDQIVEGSGVLRLWDAANDLYQGDAGLTDTYDVGVVDLYRIDPTRYAAEEFLPGRRVTLSDVETQVGITKRISNVRRDLLVPGNTQVELLDE